MWLPIKIFTAFRQQCLQKIAWIESFLKDNALSPENVTGDKLRELYNQNQELEIARQKMASARARHLTQLQEWGLRKGQQEPLPFSRLLVSEPCFLDSPLNVDLHQTRRWHFMP